MDPRLFTLSVILIQLLLAPALVVTIYGFTKAMVSAALGDPLPKRDRRVTLNPLRHIEIIGFVFFVVSGIFGWSKPVETTNLYYKNRRRDTLLVHAMPIVVIILVGLLARVLLMTTQIHVLLNVFFLHVSMLAVTLGVLNLIPVAPFDGGRILGLYLSPNQTVSLASREKVILLLLTFLMLIWSNNPVAMIIRMLVDSILSLVGFVI